jgi:hypothetical protein
MLAANSSVQPSTYQHSAVPYLNRVPDLKKESEKIVLKKI